MKTEIRKILADKTETLEDGRVVIVPDFSQLDDLVDDLNALFSLPVVSQQRELLKKWWKYFDEESVAINCNDEEREEVINNFFNCG